MSENKTIIEEADDRVIHAYWIQDRKESASIPGTYDFLPSCTCSNCGCHVERPVGFCPSCDAIMDAVKPVQV